MEENYVPIPKNLLTKLIEKGDTLVLYSSFGEMKTEELKKKFNIEETSMIKVRSNEELVNKTMMGEKLGQSYIGYRDPQMYGMCYEYSDIKLNIMKLPKEILDDNLIKFIASSSEKPEILHHNICKLHFNENGEYTIN